jgi:ribulose-5-phosphate 4-epimerase/fuculose-1-phosphate aldolase
MNHGREVAYAGMKQLLDKYARKLVRAGLADEGAPLLGGLDVDLIWNRPDPACRELERLFDGLAINSLLFARPAEPYRSLIDYLALRGDRAIRPGDSETRTFMHEIPVARAFDAGEMIAALKRRKSVIVPGRGVVTWGTVSPEQAFVSFSSVCFACLVKFFSDYLSDSRVGRLSEEQLRVFRHAMTLLPPLPQKPPSLVIGPFASEDEVRRAISEAGRLTVEYGLVDSFFGNVSYRWGNTRHISQTGSSLDELEGSIDPCPLDGSSCAAITASSEFVAHRDLVICTGMNAVLHGHPKFAVILSMDCDRKPCGAREECHIRCPEKRFIGDVPIVSGEVGAGPYGLCRTVPPAMEGRQAVMVYGHGLFTMGRDDFNDALARLLAVERMCRDEYFRRAAG